MREGVLLSIMVKASGDRKTRLMAASVGSVKGFSGEKPSAHCKAAGFCGDMRVLVGRDRNFDGFWAACLGYG